MRIVLLNDTDGRENIGCRLTSSTLKQQIGKGLGVPSPDLASFPWRFGKGPRTGRVWMSGLSWMCRRQETAPAFAGWLTQLAGQEHGDAAVNATLAADLVIFHPEGSISNYHDAVRIMDLLSLPILACVMGIPTFTMNGTFPVYPIHDRRYRLIQTFLQACRFVALRDRITAEHYGVTFMPDSAIMHGLTASARPADSRPYVLITTGANQSRRANAAVAQAAIRFCDAHHLKPLVLTKKHKDLRRLKPAILRRGGRFVEQATLAEAEHWLAQCALHIGGRYHMALFGLLLDVPSVLMLTNTHKNRWLAEAFPGIELAATVDDIAETAARLYPHSEPQKNDMRQSVLAAQADFTNGLWQAASMARESITPDARPDHPDAGLCMNIRRALRVSDVLSFCPFGIRIRLTRKS